jgi:Phage integrase, N-terminal SAM-like domain
VEQWKEGIRWFFRTARKEAEPVAKAQTSAQPEPPVWLPEDRTGWPEWKVAFLTTVRRRNYSYRTEQSYLVWIERFARHLGTENLGAQGEEQIGEFLDSLALNERLSASSQRQALNALVFLYRWSNRCGRIWGKRGRSMTRIGPRVWPEFGFPRGWNGSTRVREKSGPGFGFGLRGH